MMLGLEIADGLIYALAPIVLVGVFSLIAYLFRQNARSNEALARTAAELTAIDRRVIRLEDRIFPIVNVGRDKD